MDFYGSQAKLAGIVGVSPMQINRMVKSGEIETRTSQGPEGKKVQYYFVPEIVMEQYAARAKRKSAKAERKQGKKLAACMAGSKKKAKRQK